jgi:TonB family protein
MTKVIIGLCCAVFAMADAWAAEIPAQPKRKDAPAFPSACMPTGSEDVGVQLVTVNYAVNRNGQTESIRVRESTDPCFEETAISAVRGWTFEPRKVNGRAVSQADLETTFTFQLSAPTATQEFDARPLKRVPPRFPDRCQSRASSEEVVVLEFDVTVEGTTENIQVVDSTESCFNKESVSTVRKWRYRPKIVDGVPVERRGVQTKLKYQLASGWRRPAPEDRVRSAVRRKVLRAQRMLNREDPAQEVLEFLAEIEAEYGDTFSNRELQAFHQIRAGARVRAEDYRGALDDYRVVQRFGMQTELSTNVAKTIELLEIHIAREEANAAVDARPADDG